MGESSAPDMTERLQAVKNWFNNYRLTKFKGQPDPNELPGEGEGEGQRNDGGFDDDDDDDDSQMIIRNPLAKALQCRAKAPMRVWWSHNKDSVEEAMEQAEYADLGSRTKMAKVLFDALVDGEQAYWAKVAAEESKLPVDQCFM